MKIIVCGLGHLGTATVACLLRDGHDVVGFDVDEATRSRIGRGLAPMREPGTAALIAAGKAAGRLAVTAELSEHADADLAVVCVGTPGSADGTPDLSAVAAAAADLGRAARQRTSGRTPLAIVFRSTMLPGSMAGTVLPALAAAAGEPPGGRYEPIYNPDFTRQGHAVEDYFAPPKIVIGERKPGAAGALLALYNGIDAPRFTTTFALAELAKYADNAFHALKVAFANELGRIALHSEVAPSELCEIFLADTKLNISPAYLRPGSPFGGPCLRKDVRALAAHASAVGAEAPLIGRILDSNANHANFLASEIARRVAPPGRILLLGLSYKTGADDLRESPIADLALALLDRGYALSIHDPDLKYAGDAAPRGIAALPRRLGAALLPTMPPAQGWDLIVIAKSDPDVLATIGPRAATFNVDRL